MKRVVSVCIAIMLFCVGTSAIAGPVRVKLVGRALNNYPGTWSIINGLGVVGKGAKVFATVDTVMSGVSGGAAW
jgi:hypothetical protein